MLGQRSASARLVSWLALGAVLTPGATQAQQPDSVRVTIIRGVTPFEIQVERLARQLVGQQQRVITLSGTRQQLQGLLRTASLDDGRRNSLVTRLRLVESELSSLGTSAASLRRELERVCAPTRLAEGWVGIQYSGEYTVDITPGGAVMRVRTPPSIESVDPGSPADKAGLRRGDVILAMGGREMVDAVVDLGQLLKIGTRVPVRVRRGVESRSMVVVIEARPADFVPTCAWEDETIARALAPAPGGFTFVIGGQATRESPNPFRIGSTPPSTISLVPSNEAPQGRIGFTFSGSSDQFAAGAQLMPLNEGLVAITGVERGIFVVEVARRSSAAQSGLQAGDVIVSVEGRSVSSPGGLLQAMERADPRELRLQVMRQKRTEAVVLRW